MFSAFFGHYLLNEKLVSAEQLSSALEAQDKIRLKLGTLAINAGYMTGEQVEMVHQQQISQDKRFGDLAIEAGFLDEDKLTELLGQQKSEHLMLAQALVDLDILSSVEFEKHLLSYKEKHGLSDEAFEALKNNNIDMIVHAFLAFEDKELSNLYSDYVSLFLKNMMRFIDGHIRIDRVEKVSIVDYDHMVHQSVLHTSNIFTGIAGDAQTLMQLAGRYADEDFTEFGEYPIDATGEFLNLNNGLFIVNKSDEGLELAIDIQAYVESPHLKPYHSLYKIPIFTSFGTLFLLLGQL